MSTKLARKEAFEKFVSATISKQDDGFSVLKKVMA
jgi:hypothetical protein